jgi:hypothetical protein
MFGVVDDLPHRRPLRGPTRGANDRVHVECRIALQVPGHRVASGEIDRHVDVAPGSVTQRFRVGVEIDIEHAGHCAAVLGSELFDQPAHAAISDDQDSRGVHRCGEIGHSGAAEKRKSILRDQGSGVEIED